MKALTLALAVLLTTSTVVFAEDAAAPAADAQEPAVTVESVEISEETAPEAAAQK